MIIALRSGGKPVNSKELCRLQGEKERYLEPIMQCLVRGGILRSIRGPKGGYVLMRERRKIHLGEIAVLIKALEAKKNAQLGHSSLRKQLILPLWNELDNAMIEHLSHVTVDELCKKLEAQQSFPRKEGEDFII